MPEDRPPATTPADLSASVSGAYDHSSAASDSGSELTPVTESLRERRLRELQLQVCHLYGCLISENFISIREFQILRLIEYLKPNATFGDSP